MFLDRHLVIRSFTPAVTAIFNLIPTDRGRPILDIAHQLEDVDLAHDVRRVLDEQTPIERPVRLRSGKVFHLMRILPYRTADEHIDGVLVTFVNVTDMVAAEEQLRTLVSELNHRVRNMLQVVIGLANQTMSRSADVQQFEKAFMGRMQSLARAYELLSRGGWQEVSVADLLNIQLAPFAAEGNRCKLEGEKVMLTANAALALGLVFYELATNATKYGALSVPDGHVDVSWRLERKGEGAATLGLQLARARWPGRQQAHAPRLRYRASAAAAALRAEWQRDDGLSARWPAGDAGDPRARLARGRSERASGLMRKRALTERCRRSRGVEHFQWAAVSTSTTRTIELQCPKRPAYSSSKTSTSSRSIASCNCAPSASNASAWRRQQRKRSTSPSASIPISY